VVASLFPENLDKSAFDHPIDYVSATSKGKALEVYERLQVRLFYFWDAMFAMFIDVSVERK
jgi:predicted house-cleaning NTP pyrophosphatase (Maf/HAM1 superfamily)